MSEEVKARKIVEVVEKPWRYLTYPKEGTRKTIPAGKIKIDFYNGTVLLPGDIIEYLLTSLKDLDEEWIRSYFIETSEDVVIWLDEGSKSPVAKNDYNSITHQSFKALWIEATTNTEIFVWGSTNPEATIRKTTAEAAKAVTASGNVMKISGEVVKISGETLDIRTPTIVFTGPRNIIGSLSGGVALISGAVVSATIKADSANSGDIYLGGSNYAQSLSPYSGYGFKIEAGDAASFDIDNPNAMHGFAVVSGDVLWVLGVK